MSTEVVALKRCTGPCGRMLPADLEHFYISRSHGKDELRSRCIQCYNALAKIKAPLNGHKRAIELVGTWEQCGSCGTTKGNIIGDVDEATGEKYGYLCMKCYRLVRDFGEDLNRMRKAIDYVEKTRAARVAHKETAATVKS